MTDHTLAAIEKVLDSVRVVHTHCAAELELLNEFDPQLVRELTRELDSVQSKLYIASLNSRISTLHAEEFLMQCAEG